MNSKTQYIVFAVLILAMGYFVHTELNKDSDAPFRQSTKVAALDSEIDSADHRTGQVEWSKILVAWQQYTTHPSQLNADTLYSLLPSDNLFKRNVASAAVFDTIFNGLTFLESLVHRRDTMAARISFRLYNISDGAFTESLDQMLGCLITADPELFLQELKPNLRPRADLSGLVGNLGYDYVDKPDSTKAELKRRMETLNSVSRSDLTQAKRACIRWLEYNLEY